ncbi:SDR family NAD(P)-dependent oxidoreductase [Paraconexibacter algicola]|uniref:SDR family NAD(P)-dependent oxidoreductase n=1 Tax=Paraconexibacter algicola TaxID=2133960 RepID=UPI001304A2DD|nr:SDR family NAD(P)-dependent oxidoreductase [Paraconexibacter algicola]
MIPRAGALADRRVLLTGASSGVGRAAVPLLAAEGARLALVARRADALRAMVAERGIDALVIEADLGDRDQARRAVRDAVAHLGGLDVLVSNAGAAVFGHLREVHPDDFDRTVAVTFTGAVDVVREALPHLRERHGTIVATGSLMSRLPLPSWSSYAAAKHALRGFLTSVAIEERSQGSGVRIAMVHPGPIDTPLFAQASSATGRTPRVPPDAYRADVVAKALVACAIRPRREIVLGGETRAVELLHRLAPAVGERVLLGIDRWYRSGTESAPVPGSLWGVRDRSARVSGDIPARDSLLAWVQLGRRLAPAPATPWVLARNLGVVGVRAARLVGVLRSPRSECPVPGHPARDGLAAPDSR